MCRTHPKYGTDIDLLFLATYFVSLLNDVASRRLCSRDVETLITSSNCQTFFIISGGSHGGYLSSSEVYDIESNVYTNGPPLPYGSYYHCSVKFAQSIYIIGGRILGATMTKKSFLYNIPENTFDLLPNDMSVGRGFSHGCQLYESEGSIVVAGGSDDNSGRIITVEMLDIASGTWSNLGDLPSPPNFQWLTGDSLIAIQELTNTNLVYQYDFASDSWIELHGTRLSTQTEVKYNSIKVFVDRNKLLRCQ